LSATRSGIEIQPVYGPDDVKQVPPPPGEYPYTRGIHRNMYLGKLWTMRQYAGFGTPRETNQRFKYLLEQGQTGLSLALDLPTQLGLDADDPEAEGEVGKVGVSIGSLADMEELFAGIPLGKVSTSMTINATAPILLALYEETARKQGVPDERISGTVQNDLLKEFGARGAWLFPIEASMRLACDLIEDTVKRLPRFNPVSIASHYRDAGANPAEEMAYTLCAGKAYVENLLARGLPADSFAPRLSFFFYTYTNFFEEVAKYRAGRRIWARLLKDNTGRRSRRAGGCAPPASAAATRSPAPSRSTTSPAPRWRPSRWPAPGCRACSPQRTTRPSPSPPSCRRAPRCACSKWWPTKPRWRRRWTPWAAATSWRRSPTGWRRPSGW